MSSALAKLNWSSSMSRHWNFPDLQQPNLTLLSSSVPHVQSFNSVSDALTSSADFFSFLALWKYCLISLDTFLFTNCRLLVTFLLSRVLIHVLSATLQSNRCLSSFPDPSTLSQSLQLSFLFIDLNFMALLILVIPPRASAFILSPTLDESIIYLPVPYLLLCGKKKKKVEATRECLWSNLHIHESHPTSRIVLHAPVWRKSPCLSVAPIYCTHRHFVLLWQPILISIVKFL